MLYNILKNGDMIMFKPERRIIKDEHQHDQNESNPDEPTGLYPIELVRTWLQYSFLQHLSKFSYSNLVESFCQNGCPEEVYTNANSFKQYVGSMLKIPSPTDWFGINLEAIGQVCSIVCSVFLIIYSTYSVVALIIRIALFKTDTIGYLALFLRAAFPEFYLITVSNVIPWSRFCRSCRSS